MSDRYWRVNRNLGYGCRDCGVHVSHVDLHDAFHDRIDRLEQNESTVVAPEPTTAGSRDERVIGIITTTDNPYGPVFYYTVYDRQGNKGSTGTGPTVFGVLDMLIEGVEAYYGPTPEPSDHRRGVDGKGGQVTRITTTFDPGISKALWGAFSEWETPEHDAYDGPEYEADMSGPVERLVTFAEVKAQKVAYQAGKAHVRKVIVDRLRDLQSCHKDDDCLTKADILLVVLDDLDYEEGEQ